MSLRLVTLITKPDGNPHTRPVLTKSSIQLEYSAASLLSTETPPDLDANLSLLDLIFSVSSLMSGSVLACSWVNVIGPSPSSRISALIISSIEAMKVELKTLSTPGPIKGNVRTVNQARARCSGREDSATRWGAEVGMYRERFWGEDISGEWLVLLYQIWQYL
jgi:hypothetical protein